MFGIRQHGMLNLKIANLITDGRILEKARKAAFRMVEEDPDLEKTENAMIRGIFQSRYQEKLQLMEIG